MVNEVRRQFREIPGIMEYKAKPEYEKCVAISTKASIREMIAPGAIALLVPLIVGFGFKGVFKDVSSAEILGGLLAGVTVSGVLMGLFQSNAGGAWDNAKKSFEKGVMINGEMFYKKSEPHKASVTGDTVGDPFKDTSGPSMNILIKLMSIVSLIIAPHIAVVGGHHADKAGMCKDKMEMCAGMSGMDMGKCDVGGCDMGKVMNMSKEQCAAYCDSLKCTPEQKAMCMSHAGSAFCSQACQDNCKAKNIKCDSKCTGECHELCGEAGIDKCIARKSHEGSCVEGCNHGCKTKEECMKACGEKCAVMHDDKSSCSEHEKGAKKKCCDEKK